MIADTFGQLKSIFCHKDNEPEGQLITAKLICFVRLRCKLIPVNMFLLLGCKISFYFPKLIVVHCLSEVFPVYIEALLFSTAYTFRTFKVQLEELFSTFHSISVNSIV